ncbi:MAG: hypothetical protein ACJ8J0_08455 [Longimicrobiaceae bacterium]
MRTESPPRLMTLSGATRPSSGSYQLNATESRPWFRACLTSCSIAATEA